MKKFQHLIFILVFFLVGCSPKYSEVIQRIQVSSDSTYGYTPQNPIRIGYGEKSEGIAHIMDFLSRLRNNNGVPMEGYNSLPVIYVPDPCIFKYSLVAVGTADTVELFLDTCNKEGLFIPKGLKFQINN